MKKALVTLAIGPGYRERFDQMCRKGWTAYAERHGYNVVVIDQPLDSSERATKRSPAWQKCLILGIPAVADCERVVWVDSDILINPAAPSIVDSVPLERIGAIDESRFPTPEGHRAVLLKHIADTPDTGAPGKDYWRAWLTPGAWHGFIGLPSDQSHIVQTGVMVLSPMHHRELLERVYRRYEDAGPGALYEMRALSHEILSRGLEHWIDPKFNALVWWLIKYANIKRGQMPTHDQLYHFLLESYLRNHFLHFAGAADLMAMIGFRGA